MTDETQRPKPQDSFIIPTSCEEWLAKMHIVIEEVGWRWQLSLLSDVPEIGGTVPLPKSVAIQLRDALDAIIPNMNEDF